jgi:hypothetical protein
MRPKVLVYVTADELAEMRREAKRQHLSLALYEEAIDVGVRYGWRRRGC